MLQALHSIENEPDNTVEIVVHISETLGEERRRDLVTALEAADSIVSAEFCPLRYHLMLVRYDRDTASSQDVLASVKSQHYRARLIGPV
jgi:phosphoribosyl-ATP pyrophosphohydrolase